MHAVEFQAKVVDGNIQVPESYRDRFPGEVNVILFSNDVEQDSQNWPQQNRRRWELIAKRVRQGLTSAETEELAAAQQIAEQQVAQLGPRPTAELERLYEQLTPKD